MTRRVLITGSTGFVGSHAVEAYIEAGWQVRALVRHAARKPWADEYRPEVCVGDLQREECLIRAVSGCDVLVHCAAVTKTADRREFYRVNRDAVGLLARAARIHGVRRFVLCSTQAAVGPALDGIASRETDELKPLTDYGRSKLEGERELAEAAGAMEWVILRPPSIMGPRDDQFLPLFRAVTKNGIYPRFGSRKRVYSYIYVRDFVRALVLAGTVQSGLNQTYFVAHPEVLDWDSAAGIIARHANRKVRPLNIPASILRALGWLNDVYAKLSGEPVLLSSDKVTEILAGPWVCSTDKIERAWGFQCQYSTEEAMRETLEFYRDSRRL